jgi:LPS-assembly lipoprotein
MKKLITYLFILFISTILAGCGFHLRGYKPLPPQLHVIYIETSAPYSELTKRLTQTFRSMCIIVTTCPQDAPITLHILSHTITHQLTSQGANGQLSTYLLTYLVSYQLIDSQGHVLQCPQTIIATRSFQISANQILGDTNVQDTLVDSMRRDVIYQLLERLQSRGTLQALDATCACSHN